MQPRDKGYETQRKELGLGSRTLKIYRCLGEDVSFSQ